MVSPDGPIKGTSSLIGVALAVGAGVLIATGLNVQRLAHIRRDRHEGHSAAAPRSRPRGGRRSDPQQHPRTASEQTPLLTNAQHDAGEDNVMQRTGDRKGPRVIVAVTPGQPPPPARQSAASSNDRRRSRSRSQSSAQTDTKRRRKPRTDKGFLTSPLWLLGFGLMNGGELCNFLAYAFAPPSVVAPLGMVTLIANVFLAPIIVREPFRRKDLIGVAIAVLGGATVVYASRSNDTKPTPEQFLHAISHPLFIAYSATSLAAILVLAYLSTTKYGDRFVLIDLVLCALAGSFTVLSTKAISSFLNLMFLDTFKHWIAYPVLLVLAVTAVLQVNYVNKSLQRFESRVVIPIQYMTFALSTIVGSAILYRDFEGVGLPSLLNFAFGCLVSGGGVYLLTQDSPSQQDDSGAPEAKRAKAQDVERGPFPPNATVILDLPATSINPSRNSALPTKLVPPPAADSGDGVFPANGSYLLPVPVASRPKSGQQRTVSLTLGGGYLLAASPGAVRRVAEALDVEGSGGAADGRASSDYDDDDDDDEGGYDGEEESEEDGPGNGHSRRRDLEDGRC